MMKKKLRLFGCVLSLMLTLAACSSGKFTEEDVTNYAQWSLDAFYLGEFREEYLNEFNTDVEIETQLYLNGIAVEVEYFKKMYRLEGMTEADTARLINFYDTLYSHSKFTVGTAVAVPDIEHMYAIEIIIEPITMIEKIDLVLEDAIIEMDAVFTTEYADTDMSEVQRTDLYNARWNDLIISTCEDQLKLGEITHGAPVSVMVQVVIEETKDAYVFGLSSSDMELIDSYIIDYNQS